MHRELRREEKKQEESGDKYKVDKEDKYKVVKEDKYKVSETKRPKAAREPRERVDKRFEDEELEEHEEEGGSSDSDSGLFEMADLSQADKIVTVSVTHETRQPTSKKAQNLSRPGSGASQQQQQAHSAAAAALHPLNGLLQPTGRVPQAGYQASSFSQLEASWCNFLN